MERSEILTHLQQGLAMELTAAHQYQLHSHVLRDWGLDVMADKMREEMQEELGHADAFIERILFLKGEPSVVLEKTPLMAKSLQEMFATDLEDEKNAIAFYSAAAQQATHAGDIGTRMLFEKIAIDEEGHMGWLELQLSLLERMGEALYIAKHMAGPSE